ncbi:hypothetical protein SELMODRAFT_411485 [Selaginella moellendorffii]|uniref:Uncharacterized protein n=2 Tax=Selaginella moellendorffii TaxID=88036 RepID=D8RI35_SELML|nr:hypothetical protein SELMODRAFT_411485 [Selaginella moellendorffii]
MGIDPVTHKAAAAARIGMGIMEHCLLDHHHATLFSKPASFLFSSHLSAANSTSSSTSSANSSSHMAQWEIARQEAEARLARDYIRLAQQQQQSQGQSDDHELHQHLWTMPALDHGNSSPSSQLQSSDLASQLQFQLQLQQFHHNHASPTSTLWSPEGSASPPSSTTTLFAPDQSVDSSGFFCWNHAPKREVEGSDEILAGMGGILPGLSSVVSPASGLGEVFDPLTDCELQDHKQETLAVLEWPDAGPSHSKDYWSNVLKLVGSS